MWRGGSNRWRNERRKAREMAAAKWRSVMWKISVSVSINGENEENSESEKKKRRR
jgi:hypothetical protein